MGRGFLEGEDFGSAWGVWTWTRSGGEWEGGVRCPSEGCGGRGGGVQVREVRSRGIRSYGGRRKWPESSGIAGGIP